MDGPEPSGFADRAYVATVKRLRRPGRLRQAALLFIMACCPLALLTYGLALVALQQVWGTWFLWVTAVSHVTLLVWLAYLSDTKSGRL